MDRRPFWLAGRVVLPSAVLLGLVWSGSSALPTTTGAPAQAVALAAPGSLLGGKVHLVVTAGRHAQRHRRAPGSVAVLAAALAVIAVAAAWLRRRPAAAGRLQRRCAAARPRAPPCRP